MSAVPKRLITPQEYLAQERRANLRSEYYRGEIYAMAGANYQHTRIKDNIAREAGDQLLDGPCEVVTSDMRVKVDATGLYTYPDIVIFCSKPEFDDNVLDTLLNPRAIVEVLSESTEKYDCYDTLVQYRHLSSLQEYVLVAHNRMLVERHVRQADGAWND